MDKKYFTKNFKQTQKLGYDFVRVIARRLNEVKPTKQSNKGAIVLALCGNLGAGKTTFLQGFAKGLGIKEKVLSPTFVIMKKFNLHIKCPVAHFVCRNNFYHIDCYRINKPEEILELDFGKIISNPENIVAIEWPEKIKKALPKKCIKINFKFIDENKREIIFDL